MKKAMQFLVAIFFIAGMLASVLAITKEEATKNVQAAQAAYDAAKKKYDEAYSTWYKSNFGKKGSPAIKEKYNALQAAGKVLAEKEKALNDAKAALEQISKSSAAPAQNGKK
jgi:hypothetical protein